MKKILAALILPLLIACGAKEAQKEKKPDVKISPTGLKYIELEIGNGATAKFGSVVTVHQIVKDDKGTLLENTYENEVPFEFKIGAGETIEGLEEGISGMKIGGKRRLFVPPDLGFGRRAVRNIPRNTTLVIDVELIAVN